LSRLQIACPPAVGPASIELVLSFAPLRFDTWYHSVHIALAAAMTAFAGENGQFQQKLETAEAVRHADDSDVFEMREVAVSRKWQGTEIDRKEMSQLGRVQELRVSP
jgi:stringent starvation protein B